jgi:ribose transport system ATP-binding protein
LAPIALVGLNTPLLEARDLDKAFGGTQALLGFDFDLAPGEIHALLGENGAGKSTFIKVIAGVHNLDAGDVLYRGEPIGMPGIRDHIAFIHQDLALVPTMSVADNFALVNGYEGPHGLVSWPKLKRATVEALRQMGLRVDPDMDVGDLPVPDRAIVAIARALHRRADVLVLDEPTAMLSEPDVRRLFEALRTLRSRGVGILYVSHRLAEVRSLADRITVMRDGRAIATVRADEVSEADLADLIVGGTTSHSLERPAAVSSDVLFEAKGMSAEGLDPLTFVVRRGEVVACSGLRGAGHEIVGRAIYGLEPWVGEATLNGRPFHSSSPAESLRAGVAFVSGDRTASLASLMTVTENLFFNPAHSSYPNWVRPPARERKAARRLIDRFNVIPPDPARQIQALSGGNAQKVVLARVFDSRPQLVVMVDPTAGVDVATRAQFYRLVGEVANEGAAMLLISSDYGEVAQVANRVLVFDHGHVAATYSGREISIGAITAAGMGAVRNV